MFTSAEWHELPAADRAAWPCWARFQASGREHRFYFRSRADRDAFLGTHAAVVLDTGEETEMPRTTKGRGDGVSE